VGTGAKAIIAQEDIADAGDQDALAGLFLCRCQA
jgi:hypothetical protein